MRFARTALFAIAVAIPASGARGAPKRSEKVAVLPTTVAGEVEDHWRSDIQSGVVDGLGRGHFEYLGPDETTAVDAGSCGDARCWVDLAQRLEASFLLVTSVEKRGRDWDWVVTVIDGSSGRTLASKTDRCEICGVGEVAQRLSDDVAGMVPRLDDLTRGVTTLIVSSDPAGAEVTVDGEAAGVAPIEHQVLPGQHVIELRLPGHVVETRRIVAGEGTREELAIDLKPLPQRRRFTIAGWTTLGGGVALLAAGVTLLVLDERPYKRDCSGDNVDVNGTCRRRYDTLVIGAALTGAAVALIATGAGLLGAARRSKRAHPPSPTRRARIRPGADGVLLRF